MKNLKKIAFGLLVGAMAIGFSSFTTLNAVKRSKFFAVTYYQHANGIYSKVLPANECGDESTNPCNISYVTDPNTTFTYSSRPLTPRTESTEVGKGTN
ncbi:DUF6520 family protein [Mucilaginibacter sp. KACC 22773]|uniref:DUF6520 family protein n=1 Tax=Mucilaginibacter sp. KACC 22773 TaxID=3025671 RepID=UPI0023660024|nr:DUF6520 family protein [Mucilaginibacter sp. KACC 22773]WDF77072.1 DUF6520 family protein [Mucilaginibacter sp. KACC 22773]